MMGISAIQSILVGLALISVAMIGFASDAIAQSPPSEDPLFVRASVDNERPYLGQQIAYEFRIYRRSDFSLPEGETLYEQPDFAGFWNSEAREREEYDETIVANQYTVVELRTLLFPSVAGRIEIGSAALSGPAGILKSAPVILNVRPLPPGAPAGFTGAVGRFEIAADVKTTTVRVNEPARATVKISGEGNIGALPDPAWPEFPLWRLIESPSHADTRVSDGRITGVRSYDLALAPEAAGKLTIPAIEYAYFDPELERYVQTGTSPIVVSVADAEGSPAAPRASGAGVEDGNDPHLRPVMAPPSSLRQRGIELTDQSVYWSAWLIPTLLIVGAIIWRRRKAAMEAAQIMSRRQNALSNAQDALSRATSSGDYPAIAAAAAVLSYLSDCLGEPLTGLTSDGIESRIRDAGVPHELTSRVRRVLAQGEAVRFSPEGEDSAASVDHVERAIQLLNDLEEVLAT